MKIVKSEQNGTLNIGLHGKFSFVDHEAFREILEQIDSSEVRQVTIDLRGVDFVDSAAMGMLLLARDETEKHKKGLTLAHAGGQVKKMFDMANFGTLFTLM